MERKVLIAAPIGDGKEYSINEWLQWIADQTYNDVDVALCVNGRSEQSLRRKLALLSMCEINGKKIKLLRLNYKDTHTLKMRLSYSRDIIREYAIRQEYDYVLWLDTDTIPVFKDTIKQLIKHGKHCISGVYFYKGTTQSVIIDKETGTNMRLEKIQDAIDYDKLVEVWGFGFGCVLTSKKALEAADFDYNYKKEDWTEDFVFCDKLATKGITRWVYPRIICKHFHKKEFTIENEAGHAEGEPAHEDKYEDSNKG